MCLYWVNFKDWKTCNQSIRQYLFLLARELEEIYGSAVKMM